VATLRNDGPALLRHRGLAAFVEMLAAGIRTAFASMQRAAPNERFYFFALLVDGTSVTAIGWTEEAFARVGGHRYSVDAPYREPCGAVETTQACFDALREVDGDRLFGKGVARSKLLINVVTPGLSNEAWLVNADRLNSGAAVNRARPHF
jgi:hypothetical protein